MNQPNTSNAFTGRPMRLLILDAPDNASELFSNLLKQNGLPVHAERCMDSRQLIDSLTHEAWDLLLLNDEVADCEPADFIRLLRKSGKNTAVFVLTAAPLDIVRITQAMQAGTAGLVSLSQPEFSIMLVRRAFEIQQLRQHADALTDQNAELQQRSRLLLDSSREAIAYVHDGMHVYANASYRELLGYPAMDDLLCIPFVDLVAHDDRAQLKEKLRASPGSHGNPAGHQLSVAMTCANDSTLLAEMTLTPTLYEGEPCLQVSVLPVSVSSVSRPDVSALPVLAVTVGFPGEDEDEAEAEVIEFDNVEELAPESGSEAAIPASVLLHPRRYGASAGAAGNGSLSEAGLLAAMGSGQMTLVYHPVISTSDMEPELYDLELNLLDNRATPYPQEALRAVINAMAPDTALDKWVSDRAIRIIAELHRKGQALSFMLPVSIHALSSSATPTPADSLTSFLTRLIGNAPLDPTALVINLHLDDVLADQAGAARLIDDLRAQGFRCCISHFRPCAEMAALLPAHPVDYVRLAPALTQRLGRDKALAPIIRELLTDLHKHGARVIAAHVTDFDALAVLWEADADLVQGEYFQKCAKDLRVDSFTEQNGLLRQAG